MKCLYHRDFHGFHKNPNNIHEDGTRTLSVYLLPAFGVSIEIHYGITILIGCIQINWLE